MTMTREEIIQKRDAKVRTALSELAPIWLSNEELRLTSDAVLFNLIYQSPVDGWIDARYKYDAFSDVLYTLGIKLIREEATFDIQEKEPYLFGEVSTRVPIAPDHRLSPRK